MVVAEELCELPCTPQVPDSMFAPPCTEQVPESMFSPPCAATLLDSFPDSLPTMEVIDDTFGSCEEIVFDERMPVDKGISDQLQVSVSPAKETSTFLSDDEVDFWTGAANNAVLEATASDPAFAAAAAPQVHGSVRVDDDVRKKDR